MRREAVPFRGNKKNAQNQNVAPSRKNVAKEASMRIRKLPDANGFKKRFALPSGIEPGSAVRNLMTF
jgi:hypothetical protein